MDGTITLMITCENKPTFFITNLNRKTPFINVAGAIREKLEIHEDKTHLFYYKDTVVDINLTVEQLQLDSFSTIDIKL